MRNLSRFHSEGVKGGNSPLGYSVHAGDRHRGRGGGVGQDHLNTNFADSALLLLCMEKREGRSAGLTGPVELCCRLRYRTVEVRRLQDYSDPLR